MRRGLKNFRFAALLPAIVAAMLLTCLPAACQRMPKAADNRSYKDTQQRFALDLPKGWLVSKTDSGTVFLAPAANSSDQPTVVGGLFSASVSVTISSQPLATESGGSALEELLTTLRRQFSAQQSYQEFRAQVLSHPNGLQAAYIEAQLESQQISGGPRRLRLYGFVVGDRQVLLQALVPSQFDDTNIISGTNAILDSFIVW